MPLDGLSFAGFLQPPSVPPDPIGDAWRGLVGPAGPAGANGIGLITLDAPGPIGNTTPGTGKFSTLNVGGTGPITGFGTAIGQALGPLVNYQGSGFPGLFLTSRLIFQRATPAFNDFSDITIQRTSTFNGGTIANINSALRVQGTFGANDQTVNWLTNVSGTTNQNIGGRFVSNYVQGIRGAAGTVAFWTSLVESRDQNHVASSVSGGQQVAMEMDVVANKADDATNAGTWGGIGNRKGLHLTIAQDDTTDATPMEVSNGIWFGSNVTTRGYFKSLIGVGGNLQAYSALDTRGLIPVTSGPATVNAVTMTAGQVIDFNGGAALNSAPGNYLQYTTSGTARLRYMAGATEAFSVSNAGALGTISIDATATVRGQTGLLAGTNSIAGTVLINGAAAQTRYIQFNTAGVQRMRFGIDNTAESGSNAGSVPFINVATDAGTATQAWSVNRNTAQSLFPLIRLGKAAVYTGIAPTNDMGTLNVSAGYSGSTDHSAWTHLSSWFINSDTVDVGSAQQAIGLRGVHLFGGTGITGSRSGLHWTVQQAGAAPAHANYQAGLFSVEGNYSSGGSDLFDNTGGVLFGAGIYSTLKSGGTNWRGVVGAEIDYGIYAGATAAGITGLQIVRWNLHAYSPANFDNDNILKFTGGTTNLAKIGIQFGDYNGYPGIDPTGKMMDVVIGPGGDHTFPMGHGLDLKIPTFAATAFRSKGFSVLGDGSVQVGTAYLSSDSSGSSLDAKGSYVSAAAVATGGANLWTSEMLIDDVTGTVLSITATNNGAGPGAATAVSIYRVGYSLSPPANPVTFRVVGYAPANGMGAPTAPTINLTWTAQNALAIQPTASGKLGFNGATPIIKPTGVAVTAAGIHAALTSLGLIAP